MEVSFLLVPSVLLFLLSIKISSRQYCDAVDNALQYSVKMLGWQSTCHHGSIEVGPSPDKRFQGRLPGI